MHPLLARQLRKTTCTDVDILPPIERLLDLVDAAYRQHDDDRRLLEHSLEVVSQELTHRNQELVQQLLERKRMEVELHQALKLEAVGQLASGIAHEINTPIQYIGDSVGYVHEAFFDVKSLMSWYRSSLNSLIDGSGVTTAAEVEAAEQRADVTFALEQIPLAIERTLDGVNRVGALVRAMKQFAHPDSEHKVQSDINAALRSTIMVASNEINRVAKVVVEMADIPLLPCHLGQINQVFLNLLINAAHAIADADRDGGTVTVQSRLVDGFAEIRISDTGLGIPAEIQDRIFEPFFTTKDVGRGTGQGLAIARSIVYDKHKGTIDFETVQGIGTTFVVRLPLTERQ